MNGAVVERGERRGTEGLVGYEGGVGKGGMGDGEGNGAVGRGGEWKRGGREGEGKRMREQGGESGRHYRSVPANKNLLHP